MATKREALRLTALENTLVSLGFTSHEADKLRRISLTLRRWHELECGTDGGSIERDEATGKPYWLTDSGRRWPMADRERGALKRLGHIVGMRNTRVWAASAAHAVREVAVNPYIQTDPRGAALYILRPGDVPAGAKAESCYSNGICVY
jgi:hypothetical protein